MLSALPTWLADAYMAEVYRLTAALEGEAAAPETQGDPAREEPVA